MTYTRLNPKSYLPLSGGELSGNLTLRKATPALYMRDTAQSYRIGDEPGDQVWGNHLYGYDANGDQVFYSSSSALPNGRTFRSFVNRRLSADGNEAYTNGFYLGLEANGDPYVSFTPGTAGKKAWLDALGLLDVSYTSTAADVFTPAAGVTLVEASMARWGKLVQVYVRVALATATGAGDITNTALGTLAVKPRTAASLSPSSAGGVAGFFANASGTVYVTATHAASTTLSFGGTYLSA